MIRPFSGIRLPPPTYEEEMGAPVTTLDAAGRVLAVTPAAAWRAAHDIARCPHGHRHCFACRHRLTNSFGRLPPAAIQSDAELIDAVAAGA